MSKSAIRDLVGEAHKGAAGSVGRLSLMLASGRLRVRSLTEAADDLEEAARTLRSAIEEAQNNPAPAPPQARGGPDNGP
jgi:hypothetical protein